MARLGGWKFDTSDGAMRGGSRLRTLQALRTTGRPCLQDAAWASWTKGETRPTTGLVAGIASDEVWGADLLRLLLGVIFYAPLLDAAVGTITEETSRSLADVGIGETHVNRVRDAVAPGTSALFVLGCDEVAQRVADLFRDERPVEMVDVRLRIPLDGDLLLASSPPTAPS